MLHGVATQTVTTPSGNIEVIKSSIVALVGIAPLGPVNQLTLCNNATDDAQFGKPLPGFNIPKVLSIIRQVVGSTPIVVINVFDSTSNLSQVTDEPQTVTNGKLSLAYAPVSNLVIKNNDGTNATIVAGTDYSIDAYGNFIVLSSSIADATTFKFSYKKLNAGSVNASQIIGSIDDTTEVRTGTKLLDVCYNTFGFTPKILITPGYSTLSSVAAAFVSLADKFRAVYLQDAPYGTTVSGAITGRGPSGTINFSTNSTRVLLCYPFIKTYDEATNSNLDYPASASVAALGIWVDKNLGYWESWSNKALQNAVGVERIIEFNINNEGSQSNLLNGAGISTVINTYGSGYKWWGNRSSAYPTDTSKKSFLNIQRIDDIVSESIELSVLEDVDKGITPAFKDYLVAKGNNFMSTLIQKGALYPGSRVEYHSDDNSQQDLAAGKITLTRIYDAPSPAETIIFKSVLDISIGKKALG